MKALRTQAAVVLLCIGLGVVLAGCQTPGRVVASESSVVCPTCKAVTRTALIKGTSYTTCLCPSCKTVSPVGPALAETLRTYMGNEPGDKVHVCDHCKSMVETCSVCRKQAGR